MNYPHITIKMVDNAMFWNNRRSSMGYVQDPSDPANDGRSKGYCYWYRCVEFPRLEMEHRTWTLDDAATERFWRVDGERCIDLAAACAMLSQPPLMSLLEAFAYARLPPDPFPFWLACQWIGGVIPDNPSFIDVEGRYRIAFDALTGLQNKGLVKYRADDSGMMTRCP